MKTELQGMKSSGANFTHGNGSQLNVTFYTLQIFHSLGLIASDKQKEMMVEAKLIDWIISTTSRTLFASELFWANLCLFSCRTIRVCLRLWNSIRHFEDSYYSRRSRQVFIAVWFWASGRTSECHCQLCLSKSPSPRPNPRTQWHSFGTQRMQDRWRESMCVLSSVLY